MTEEDWAALQRKAIGAAEAAPVPLSEFLEGLKVMRVELTDRIEQVESEVASQGASPDPES